MYKFSLCCPVTHPRRTQRHSCKWHPYQGRRKCCHWECLVEECTQSLQKTSIIGEKNQENSLSMTIIIFFCMLVQWCTQINVDLLIIHQYLAVISLYYSKLTELEASTLEDREKVHALKHSADIMRKDLRIYISEPGCWTLQQRPVHYHPHKFSSRILLERGPEQTQCHRH